MNDFEDNDMNIDADMEMEGSEQINIDRKELIYAAKICLKAEKIEEAITFCLQFIQINPILNSFERNLFINSFKKFIMKKRSSWRIIHSKEKKVIQNNQEEESSKLKQLSYLKEIRIEIENEIIICVKQMIQVINNFLLPVCEEDPESAVFYLKLKGDYLRYYLEIASEDLKQELYSEAESSYMNAIEISQEHLPLSSITKLGLILNYTVFLWDSKMHLEAYMMAQNAFSQIENESEELGNNKEAIYIIQLLKENLQNWMKDKSLMNALEKLNDGESGNMEGNENENENEDDNEDYNFDKREEMMF